MTASTGQAGHATRRQPHIKHSVDPPFARGHECVARVVETGDAVTTVTPGDLVVVPWSINCGSCDHCGAGAPGFRRRSPYGSPCVRRRARSRRHPHR
ncbi:alcohol dehydrogenase catalytic domain-containing protein [Streptomyces acidicola]|uniref:alcohol dehydrogenase catalytic domain-containing protein n=1 Tax=Streptomyces acidicola TaxID=2596892 RepID=UPI00389AD829